MIEKRTKILLPIVLAVIVSGCARQQLVMEPIDNQGRGNREEAYGVGEG